MADSRLDQILAILTGRKVYDETTGLWRVYDSGGTELADPSGILLRGLHGFLLRQYVVQEEPVSVSGGFRKRRSKRRNYEPTEEQIRAERIRLGIIEAKEEKKAVLAKAKKAVSDSGTKQELKIYAYLLRHEIARLESEYAILKASLQARGEQIRSAAIQEIARQQIEHEIELARIEEEDISFLLAVLLEL